MSKVYKLVVLGSGGVGKSALTIRLVTDNFLQEYDPTIEDTYSRQFTIDEDIAALDILDTAGQEEYSTMQDQWMREGRGFMLVYSITDSITFNEMSVFRDKILRAKEADSVPIVLVGNKCDLENERQVSFENGRKLADSWGAPFMETSAKENVNNEECFFQVVREIRAEAKAEEERVPEKRKLKLFGVTCNIL